VATNSSENWAHKTVRHPSTGKQAQSALYDIDRTDHISVIGVVALDAPEPGLRLLLNLTLRLTERR
jgi:hypothetical protein